MAKITLNNVTSGFQSTSRYNTNLNSIEDHLNNKVLYRDNPGGEPNQLLNDIDMNSNDIINTDKIDAVTANLQNLNIGGTPVSPSGLSFVDLPSVSGHAGKFLHTDGVTPFWSTIVYDTVADMKAATDINDGDVVRTIEHTAGYGYFGGNLYLVRPVTGASDDNGSVIKSTGSGSYEFVGLFPNGVVRPEHFGAHQNDDTVDSTSAFQAMIAYSNIAYLGPGPYQIDAPLLLADKGTINSSYNLVDSTTWYCAATHIKAGSTIGVASDQAIISLGTRSSIIGHIAIDGDNNANVIGLRFGWDNGTFLEPSLLNYVESVYATNCRVGVSLRSDGNSGVYRNHIGSAHALFCTTGIQAITDTGITKVNDNNIGALFTAWCDWGVNIKVATALCVGMFNSEASKFWNLLIEDSYGIYISGGHMENVEDFAAIDSISDDGSITVLSLTYTVDPSSPFHREFENGDTIRIRNTSTSLDDSIWTIEQKNVAGADTVKLTGGPTGLTGTGDAFLHPGRNLRIDSGTNTNGIYLNMTIANVEGIDIPPLASNRKVVIYGQGGIRSYARAGFESIDIGPRHPVTNNPTADHDLANGSLLRVASGMYTYRNSSGTPDFFFTSPAVPSGTDTSWVFRNNSSVNRFRVRHDADIGIARTITNTNTPSGATAYELEVTNANGTVIGYIPIYGSPW